MSHSQETSRNLDNSAARIRAVIDDCLRRRAAGEAVSEEAVIAAHPELMPELGDELRKLRIIDAARKGVIRSDALETKTHSAGDKDTPSGHLEIRCPSCHTPMEVAVDTLFTDLICSTCGSHFSLVDQSNATDTAPPLSQLGRFDLIERIGFGGFGSVWKARDKELDRVVAIKIPRQGCMTAEQQEKFYREARAAAQLQHPNIVSVHEVGRDGESLFIVSDFVRGVTLDDWLTGQQLTSREAAELCAKIADALHHAHEHGVVHRDLKPANIIIDGAGQPHITDFGLARREVDEVTVTMNGQILGTPAYMSPEQAQGEAHTADCRSDVYSLGVILFKLLSGELPFRGNREMMVFQHIHDSPPSPRKFNPNISKDLETITLKCLEKEATRRYQTAQALDDELRRFIVGEPIYARPVGRVERAWRWCRRKPAMAGLVAACGLVVATILASGGRELHARHQAMIQQSEILISNAETFAQRGEWRAALENLGRADQLGHADPIRVRLARVRALIALGSSEYPHELELLGERNDLGERAAEIYLLQGMSLTMRGEQEAGIGMLQRARSSGNLPPAEAAIADAMLAQTSPEHIRKLELAVKLDPLSHYAHSYLFAALFASGRLDDAIRRAEVAAALFPESPTYPLALALAAGWKLDQRQVDEYLQMPALRQLSPNDIDSFRKMLSAIVSSMDITASGFDFDVTPDEFDRMLQVTRNRQADVYRRILQFRKHFAVPGSLTKLANDYPHADGPDSPQEAIAELLGDAGVPCIHRAYRPIRDVMSLRTFGFLMTGKGDTKRIDRLIEQCAESSKIHPDGLFQCIRGRLLYARGRLAEAASAYKASASSPCTVPILRRDAFAHAARCYFELYQQGQIDALPEALRFVQQRLEMGPVGSAQAVFLNRIALIAGDFDAARRLIRQLENVKDASWIAVRRAEIELADGNYLDAVNLVGQVPEESELIEDARRIRTESLKRARECAAAVASAIE